MSNLTKHLSLALAFGLSLVPAWAAKPKPPIKPSPTVEAAPFAKVPVTDTLRAMLVDYRRYAEHQWHADTAHPGLGYWGSGKGEGGNEGVRAITTTALAYAVLAHEGDTTFKTADRVGPALRYAANIYVTGPLKGTDNKHWGNSWQSAMWAGNLGTAAWLVKDTLDPDTMAAVKKAVGAEADRFIGQMPPTMEPGDTKAEENAWDLTAPAAALLLMPDDPHALQWHEAVLRYGFNTISTEADKTSKAPADGKTVGDWVTTTQVYPDFTLENHGIFHPVYSMIGPATNAQAAVDYKLGGKPVPDALTFNVLKQWGMLQYIALADGEWLYPQGLDWDLHDYEHLHYWTMLATQFHDPTAALLEQRTVGYARKRQQINGDGSFVGPSGSLGFAREAVQAERVAFALLMHAQFGPPPASSAADWDKMTAQLTPAKSFPFVGMVIHRAPRGVVSFSWKNHLMAQIVPQSETHLDQPYVTTPNAETLVGGFQLQGQNDGDAHKFAVTRQTIQTTADGFRATVDATINAGSLHQQIAVISLFPGVVAYVDRVTALKPVTVTEERGLPLGIENDDVTGNQRYLTTGAGELTIPGGQGQDHALTGNWANVDGRLGLISAFDAPLLYRAAGKPNRAGAREDFLMGDYRRQSRTFAPGDVVAVRAALILPDASVQETARLAANVHAERSANGLTLKFTASDGKSHALTLDAAGAGLWDSVPVK